MIKTENNGQTLVSVGTDALDFNELLEVLLKNASIIQKLRNIFALEGSEFSQWQASKTICAATAPSSTQRVRDCRI